MLLEGTIKQYRKFQQQEFAKRSIDITSDQWSVLECASKNPEIAQKDIALLTHKDPASVTRIIDILVEKALLERAVDKNDRRALRIQVTEKGMGYYKEVSILSKDMLEFGLRGISMKEWGLIMDNMKKIKSNFE